MKVIVFNAKAYDKEFLNQANQTSQHEIVYIEAHLNDKTVKLAQGFEAVCAFVNDHLDRNILEHLSQAGVKLIALRCAGFNNVDLKCAEELGMTVLRVPEYSPRGVAEHALALMLALNRKIYRSHNRVREGNFTLNGLLGFEIYKKTVGVIGTGKIGILLARIMCGMDARVIAYDTQEHPDAKPMGVEYVSLEEIYKQSDIISLHVPLLPATHHMIDENSLKLMKDGVMLINTSRGGLIDTQAVVNALKSGKIGYLGLDVYEEEEALFFEDLSSAVIQDDVFSRLLTFPNVIITGHQAFFTNTALTNIADTTIENLNDFAAGTVNPRNQVLLK